MMFKREGYPRRRLLMLVAAFTLLLVGIALLPLAPGR